MYVDNRSVHLPRARIVCYLEEKGWVPEISILYCLLRPLFCLVPVLPHTTFAALTDKPPENFRFIISPNDEDATTDTGANRAASRPHRLLERRLESTTSQRAAPPAWKAWMSPASSPTAPAQGAGKGLEQPVWTVRTSHNTTAPQGWVCSPPLRAINLLQPGREQLSWPWPKHSQCNKNQLAVGNSQCSHLPALQDSLHPSLPSFLLQPGLLPPHVLSTFTPCTSLTLQDQLYCWVFKHRPPLRCFAQRAWPAVLGELGGEGSQFKYCCAPGHTLTRHNQGQLRCCSLNLELQQGKEARQVSCSVTGLAKTVPNA